MSEGCRRVRCAATFFNPRGRIDDRHTHPNSRREFVVELTRQGRRIVGEVTTQRRNEPAARVEVAERL
jgi:hypothetical protein